MPEVNYAAAQPRSELIDAIRDRASAFDPPLRVLAVDVLGAGSPIDVVASEAAGGLVLVMVGEQGEDLTLFTRALAQRAWVTPRIRDWLKLAPALGLAPDAPVKLALMCPSYRPETLAAAQEIGPEIIALSTYRWVETGASISLLIEPIPSPRAPQESTTPTTPRYSSPATSPPGGSGVPSSPARPASPRRASPSDRRSERQVTAVVGGSSAGPRFRTGLTDEDLNLTPQETRDFD